MLMTYVLFIASDYVHAVTHEEVHRQINRINGLNSTVTVNFNWNHLSFEGVTDAIEKTDHETVARLKVLHSENEIYGYQERCLEIVVIYTGFMVAAVILLCSKSFK
jgi:hypothetical protein